MIRRKFILCWTLGHAIISLIGFLILIVEQAETAIVAPPWSDPAKNPCAALPGGWQLLYWPPLKKCFKIFTIGFPCPETMELSPGALVHTKRKIGNHNAPAAECRCPPGTALSTESNKCHTIFERGPCERGKYFKPLAEKEQPGKRPSVNRWGTCTIPNICPENMIFWPRDGKCYMQYTKGPCIKGKLIVLNDDDLAECRCDNAALREFYYIEDDNCHEHYTKGPCSTPGHIFLPGGHCDCMQTLPQYYPEYQMCYELNTPGPCAPGHTFTIKQNQTNLSSITPHAECQCKDGYVPWSNGICYRLFTRGPCGPNEFIINATSCVHNFCGKSRLYFPDQKSCYRIGSQGPCALNQVVVFDFTARPSIDGISYNGMCGCSGVIMNLDQQCTNTETIEEVQDSCELTAGMVNVNGNCYKLYSKGPCNAGQWLEPLKQQTPVNDVKQHKTTQKAKCVCRPGYTQSVVDGTLLNCNAPTVGLARCN